MNQLKGSFFLLLLSIFLFLLMVSLLENPVNWALAVILAYVVRSYAQSSKKPIAPAKHPLVTVFQDYTPTSLLVFDGNGKDNRILIAVNGSVYDVSRGRNFYGPGGPYENFAGHDASRGLAKNSFDEDMITDPLGPIDKLEDLAADEWESLREWELHFATKYFLVGKFVENEE
ncbi:cytochrome b5-like heme/steroid binding domain-containing protein [Spinellus fusiger]|nr:cytochrome b5-like heme/steroid binding domain-containing protein [Spinellus fusiger]